MTSTLLTCTSSTRPGSPGLGDTLYETDTKQIITYDGSDWQEYDSDGVGGDDLAYPDAKTGNPTSGTNYVITVQPDCHYDASKYVTGLLSCTTVDTSTTVEVAAGTTGGILVGTEVSGTGIAAGTTVASITDSDTFEVSAAATAAGTNSLTFEGLGISVGEWGDRSGKDNDATQVVADDQPTYVKNHGNFGLQWPDANNVGFLDTNYTPATDPPGHTLVVVANIPTGASYSGMLNNWGYQTAGGFYNAGLMVISTGDITLSSAGALSAWYASSPINLAQYTRVYACVDVDDDQKTFLNLAQSQTGTASYTQVNLSNKLDSTYRIGSNGYKTMGATAANGHGGIIYEALIFQSALSYTSDGTNLTAGNLKIVVDYLMNKYQISTDLIS